MLLKVSVCFNPIKFSIFASSSRASELVTTYPINFSMVRTAHIVSHFNYKRRESVAYHEPNCTKKRTITVFWKKAGNRANPFKAFSIFSVRFSLFVFEKR